MKCEVCNKKGLDEINVVEIAEGVTEKAVKDSYAFNKRILCCDDCLINLNFRKL